jgi:hypothetical protein
LPGKHNTSIPVVEKPGNTTTVPFYYFRSLFSQSYLELKGITKLHNFIINIQKKWVEV